MNSSVRSVFTCNWKGLWFELLSKNQNLKKLHGNYSLSLRGCKYIGILYWFAWCSFQDIKWVSSLDIYRYLILISIWHPSGNVHIYDIKKMISIGYQNCIDRCDDIGLISIWHHGAHWVIRQYFFFSFTLCVKL